MDREERLRREQGERLQAARKAAGFRSAREAALANDWPESSYRAHENGTRTIGRDDAERYVRRFTAHGGKSSAQHILFGSGEPLEDEGMTVSARSVPIMGYIGAGAEIFPEFEQVPPEGLDTVELPFPVPPDIIGLQVRGDSMLPTHEDGDVLCVWREQRFAIESYIGEVAAVRTFDGRRFLKRLLNSSRRGLFNLESSNARMIEEVRVEWIGEIFVTVKLGQIQRIKARERSRQGRRTQVRLRETSGMDELPLRE